jgi:hypothetical protein
MMTRTIIHSLTLIVAASLNVVVATAQPHGWSCDYGYRPGNTWFYRSSALDDRVYQLTVRRDSIDADGAYWADVTWSWEPANWFRIDSSCAVDRFTDPSDNRFRHWLSSQADQGSKWTVESSSTKGQLNARVDTIYQRSIFGRLVEVRTIVYTYSAYGTESWYLTEEWAEGFGVVSSWGGVSIHDELVGAVIDGVAYGNVSGVADGFSSDSKRFMIYPLPASGKATLMLTAHVARPVVIAIHDMLGRLVHCERLDALHDGVNTIPLDVTGLAPGSYFVAVALDGARFVTPLVVAR